MTVRRDVFLALSRRLRICRGTVIPLFGGHGDPARAFDPSVIGVNMANRLQLALPRRKELT